MKITIFKLTLLLQLHHLLSLGENHYGKCMHMTCGNLTIGFPFYMKYEQATYCGVTGFEVYCKDNKYALFNVSDNTYIIQNIWYKKEKFQIINSAFVGTDCLYSVKNMSLVGNNRLTFADNHDDLLLFPNCSDRVVGEYKDREVKCRSLVAYKNDSKLRDFEGGCIGLVTEVPYYEEGQKGGSIVEVLERGILLNWNAYNCSDCEESGGQCGFDAGEVDFNCYCTDRTHALHCTHKKTKRLLILGICLGGSILFLLLGSLALWKHKKQIFGPSKLASPSASLDRSASNLERGSVYFGVPLFSYSELLEATDNFKESKELGDGGFGIVYYGKLKDGREVAIKRLYEKTYRRMEQFMNEIRILTCLRHQNLVSLYGCTSQHSKELLLVYEYVENGTVADHIYGEKAKDGSLTWPVRLGIAIETASALSYLHASDIVHRDVKTNNILLDANFRVRVADFGLSRLFPNDVTHVSTAPQGTPGYVDPEYHQCYQLTDKSDVYSFGVVLIELISSLPAIDMNRHRHEINLSNYAMNRIQRCAFDELVDPQLGFATDTKVRKMTTMVAELAFQCLQHDKEFRPSMDVVLENLKRIQSEYSEGLQTEEEGKESGEAVKMPSYSRESGEVVKMPSNSNPPASPIEDVQAPILNNNHKLHPPSPISVMEKWDSRSTTHSKANKV